MQDTTHPGLVVPGLPELHLVVLWDIIHVIDQTNCRYRGSLVKFDSSAAPKKKEKHVGCCVLLLYCIEKVE